MVIFFSLVVSVYAQSEKSDVDTIVTRMKVQLNLTQAQVEAIKPIIEEYTLERQQLRETLRDQGVTDSSIILSRMEQLRQEEKQRLTKILTPVQLKKWSSSQKISNVLNKDQMADNGWAPKGTETGFGESF